MRIKTGLGLLFAIFSLSAQAESGAPPALPICQILADADLGKIGYTLAGEPRANSMDITAERSGAPSDIHSDICFYYSGEAVSRKSVSLVVDRFTKIEGVAAWLKMKSDAAKDDKTLLTEIGDTVCEEGEYSFATTKSGDSSTQPIQHYIACDRLVGHRRISLSIEMPDQRAGLPTPAESNLLLGLAISRLPK